MSATQPDWELSKENIQPLKSGRKASKLENISKPKDLKVLNEERMQYETELRMYDGNDPLDPWYRSVKHYILKTILTSFPNNFSKCRCPSFRSKISSN